MRFITLDISYNFNVKQVKDTFLLTSNTIILFTFRYFSHPSQPNRLRETH